MLHIIIAQSDYLTANQKGDRMVRSIPVRIGLSTPRCLTVRGCGRFPGLSGDKTCLLKKKKSAPLSFISNMVRSWLPFENLRRKGHHCHGLTHLSWAERKIFYRVLGKKFCGLFIYPGQSVRQVVAVYAPGDRGLNR